MRKMFLVLLAGSSLLLSAGCGPRAGADVGVVISEAQRLAAEGKVDKALSRLNSYYNSRHYKNQQEAFLGAMLSIELRASRTDAALTRFRVAVDKAPEQAGRVIGVIEDYFMSRGLHQELMRWCNGLQGGRFDEWTVSRLATMHLNAMVQSEQLPGIPGVFGGYLARMTESGALSLTHVTMATLIRGRHWDVAEQVLGIARSKFKGSPAGCTALVNETIDLVLARDGYKAALVELQKVIRELPDAAAARNVRVVGDAVFSAGDREAGDTLFPMALDSPSGNVMTQDAGADGWMRMATRSGIARDVLSRLEDINRRNVQPSVIIRLINGAYPVLLGKGDHDTHAALFSMCQSLDRGRIADYEKTLLGGMMLDISYFLEDFEASLKLIEEGAGGIAEDQKALMCAKVRAHIAMKKQQPREAVKHLREFMGLIEKQGRDEVDPVNKCRVTCDMILGLNAKRIGDLLKTAGAPEEARQAYGEARGYYQKAAKEFPDPASKENITITKGLSEIPE